jgi:hypothetical protein
MNRSNTGSVASIRDRLLNISKAREEEHQFVLMEYARERLLYRLSRSRHASRFILKGAASLFVWSGQRYRPTRDIDLLGFGSSEIHDVRAAIQEICQVDCPEDGLSFDTANIQVWAIREEAVYSGVHLEITALLGTAQIPVHVDVGFGDTITPAPEVVRYPVLLDMEPPMIRMYPMITTIAEKLEAMVTLGVASSRMKDFYDLFTLSNTQAFVGEELVGAIRATFQRRGTELPEQIPVAFSETFARDSMKSTQWTTYIRRLGMKPMTTLDEVVVKLREFCFPPLLACRSEEPWPFRWPVGGPWND